VLAQLADHMRAAHRIDQSVDETQRDFFGQRRDPTLAVLPPLAHVADEPMIVSHSVADALPIACHLFRARLRLRPEDLAERFLETLSSDGPRNQEANRRSQQLLDGPRPMQLREESAVEEADAGDARLPRQQLLRDGVSQIVREQVDLLDSQVPQHELRLICISEDRIRTVSRLAGEAKANIVEGDHLVSAGERSPKVLPIPRAGGKAVQEQQRLAAALGAIEDALAFPVEKSSGPAPG
jgi:hypothetical protein